MRVPHQVVSFETEGHLERDGRNRILTVSLDESHKFRQSRREHDVVRHHGLFKLSASCRIIEQNSGNLPQIRTVVPELKGAQKKYGHMVAPPISHSKTKMSVCVRTASPINIYANKHAELVKRRQFKLAKFSYNEKPWILV